MTSSQYNLLEVNPPERFFELHQKCIKGATHTFQNNEVSNIGLVFLNTYKIHIELVDATIELLKAPNLNHITSSMVVRSIFENVATFKHIAEADEAIAIKYLGKLEVFKKLTLQKSLKILEAGDFGNLSRFDDSSTLDRVAKLSPSAKMTYDMLSAYTHISPFITVQMKAGASRISKAKHNNLQAIYVAYLSLLFYAYSAGVHFESQSDTINILKELLDEGEQQGIYG